MRRAGLDKALADMVEITYVDAPNDASGPPPEDVKPFFQVRPSRRDWQQSQVVGRQKQLSPVVLTHLMACLQGPYKEWWSAQQVSHCALHHFVL